ncbi:hypothetical protein MTO96_012907 [Rhipicephalus appendiculatus]
MRSEWKYLREQDMGGLFFGKAQFSYNWLERSRIADLDAPKKAPQEVLREVGRRMVASRSAARDVVREPLGGGGDADLPRPRGLDLEKREARSAAAAAASLPWSWRRLVGAPATREPRYVIPPPCECPVAPGRQRRIRNSGLGSLPYYETACRAPLPFRCALCHDPRAHRVNDNDAAAGAASAFVRNTVYDEGVPMLAPCV